MKMFEGQIHTPPPGATSMDVVRLSCASGEYHVNGRGTTMRPQTQRLGLRLGIVAGTNSRAMSIDMALSTCCDVRSNAY